MNLSKLIQDNQWYRVLTSPFVHQNPIHVGVNILALWGCCSRVEIVFGSLFFFKYTVMLMFIEAFGSLIVVQCMVRLYRHRRNLYRSTTQCINALTRAPETVQRSFSRAIDAVTNRTRGAYAAVQREDERDEEGSRGLLAREDGGDGEEEEGNGEEDRETDRRTGNNNMEQSAEQEEDTGDVYDAEEDSDTHRRSSFASIYDHPLTSEPVMGFSGIILAWMAFIAFQWFLRGTTIGTSDST